MIEVGWGQPYLCKTVISGYSKGNVNVTKRKQCRMKQHKKPDKIETKVKATMRMEGFWVKFQLWHQTKPISQLVMV